jgi:hypothetical protein
MTKEKLFRMLNGNSARLVVEKNYSPTMKGRLTNGEHCPRWCTEERSFLDSLSLMAIVRASILGPFSGQSFADFLLALCKHLSLVSIDEATFDSSMLGSTANFTVPFLAPVNATFSSNFRSIEGVYVGTVISPKYKFELDGIVLPCSLVPESLAKIARRQLPAEICQAEAAPKNTGSSKNTQMRSIGLNNKAHNEKDGLVITVDNYAAIVDIDMIKASYEKALKLRKTHLNSDPQLKKHVHLIFSKTMKTEKARIRKIKE